MIKRKLTAILTGSFMGLILFGLLILNLSLAERISYAFQLLPFAFPLILLYGGTVTLLSDYIANRYEGSKRLFISFFIHVGFGVLFGIVFPSKMDISLLGFNIDMFSLIATIVAISIWGIDELLHFNKVNKRLILFITGLIVFIITTPFTVLMTLEEIKEKEFAERYSTSRGTGDSIYRINHNEIEIIEEIDENQTATMDRWKNKTMIGDITVLVNNNKLISLEDYPIRIDWKGIERYHGQLSMFRLTDNEEKSSKIIVMVNAEERDMTYIYYEINESGNVQEKSFHKDDRSFYETFLLNNSTLPPGSVDYYGEGYHTPAFPASTLVGILMIGFNWPRRRLQNLAIKKTEDRTKWNQR